MYEEDRVRSFGYKKDLHQAAVDQFMCLEAQARETSVGAGVWIRIAVAQPKGEWEISELNEYAIWLPASEAKAFAGKIVNKAVESEEVQKELDAG